MEKFGQLRKNPAFIMRAVISFFLVIGLLCFLFPMATMMPNTADNVGMGVLEVILQIFGEKMPDPRHLSGVQLIFAFLSEDTIHENLNIGPLPCNAYILIAFLAGILAVALLWLNQKKPMHLLFSALSSLVSASLLIIFVPRFVGYYTAHTKNGGEQFGHLFADERMIVQSEPALIVAIVCFFFAFMVAFMLYFNAKNDPFFRGE